ncbi:MAG: hypothetical protein IKA77_00155 [Clostridia bacterium]|nr:hypothetical protein [Clostridia bacterium]
MSRRLIILVVVLIGALALTISACSPVDLEGEQCTEHVWENEIVMGGASCTESGKALQRCSVCGKSQQVDIEPLGHDLVVKDNSGISATCEGEGFTGKLGCSRCDYQEEGTVIPALGHSWDEGKVTTAPTCEGTGVKTYTCLNDGSHTKTEEVSAVGHAYGEWIQGENGNHKKVCANDDSHVITEACSGGSNRCDELAICAVCGNAYGELKDHVYDQEKVDDEYLKSGANCTFGAIYYKSCVCGAFDETLSKTFEVGEPAGHNYENRNAEEKHLKAPATCESGAVYYTSCVCGEHDENLSSTFTFGDPLGHDMVEADCENDGYCKRDNCDYTEAKLGHDWQETGVILEPTCTTEGTMGYECANDSAHTKTEPIDATGHNYDTGVVTAPTCMAQGYTTYTCGCGHEIKDNYVDVDENAHEYGAWEVVTPATCTSEGEEKQVCANDATHVVTRPISKLNHNHNIKSYQIIDGVLKLVRECACGTSQVLDDVDNTATIAVSNASDLEAVLNGGGYAVILEDNITLDNGVITITKDATLYLNGKTITSNVAKSTESVVGTKSVCDVFLVQGDVTFNINGDGKLLATHSEAQTVCVLSAIDGATVNIYGGEYVSSGCTTIYARTNSVINVFDGKFVAEDNSYGYLYTLDIWEGEDEEIWAEINVYGGEYVAFNPANHQGDGTYTNKLVEGVHSLLVEGAYIVSDHEYDDGVVTAPTCTADGYTTYTCTLCNGTKTDNVVPKNGHSEVVDQAVAATCTESGLTEGKHCSVCNEVLVAQTEIPALGHDMTTGDCVTDAKCQREGCGYVEEDSALGHDMVEATCMQDAYCKREGCGHVVADSKKDHDFTQGNVCPTCASTKKTVNVTIADYADATGWANDTKYEAVNIDKNITATAKGGGNTGKYYTSGTNWRFYQTENPALTLSVAEGGSGSIVSVKITYSRDKTGILTLNGNNVTSGSVVNVNNTTITFGVGNTGTATNGQVRITAIEVIYIAPPCKHTDVREDAYKAPTCAEEGREAGTWCNDCESYISGGEEIPATGEHENTEEKEEVAPTCIEAGITAGIWCNDCGNYISGGEEIPATGEHADNDSDNKCDTCDKDMGSSEPETPAGVKTTVNKTIATLKTENGWSNSNKYSSFKLDDVVTVTSSGKDNTGKYYDSGSEYRLYQTESPSFKIEVAEGYKIVSVKITYNVSNTGCLTYNGSNVSSGTIVEVNSTSITFGVGNTGTKTNGQAKVTAIEVVYETV